MAEPASAAKMIDRDNMATERSERREIRAVFIEMGFCGRQGMCVLLIVCRLFVTWCSEESVVRNERLGLFMQYEEGEVWIYRFDGAVVLKE